MRKRHGFIVTLLLAFGVFVNLSSDLNSKSIEASHSVIVINSDETIDGKH